MEEWRRAGRKAKLDSSPTFPNSLPCLSGLEKGATRTCQEATQEHPGEARLQEATCLSPHSAVAHKH
eukprot:1160840-Pelagomonas_calceolata.AAC.1